MFFIPALFNVIASVAASITTTQALAVVEQLLLLVVFV